MSMEFGSNLPKRLDKRGRRIRKQPRIEKIPVLFPVSREFGSRDWFDCDCVRHHALFRTRSVPQIFKKLALRRAFLSEVGSLQRQYLGGAALLPAKSPASKSWFLALALSRAIVSPIAGTISLKAECLSLAVPFRRHIAKPADSHSVG